MKEFLRSHHFDLVVVCDCPEICIEGSLSKLIQSTLPPNVRIVTQNNLNSREQVKVRQFRIDGYIKTHFWSPPIEREQDAWSCTDQSSEEKSISWVAFYNDEILLTSDSSLIDGEFWLSWGWHNENLVSAELLTQVWKHVLRLQLTECTALSRKLIGEFDSTDRFAQFKRKLLVEKAPDRWNILQQN